MTMAHKPLLLCAALATVLTAATQGAVSAPDGPEGTEWRLVEAGGAPIAPLPGDLQPYFLLDHEDQKVSGYSGCNSFFGGYLLEGSRLDFGLLGSTRRACPEEETSVEEKLLGVLGKTRKWKITDGDLVLLDDSGELARFKAVRNGYSRPDPGSLTYRSPRFPSGTVTLSHGEYRGPAAPGSASETVVKMTGTAVFGRIAGKRTGAVVLVTSSGGTGSFYELALLERGAKGWENRDTVLLGDRVSVQAVAIANDRIIVDMTTHGPRDPLCCPTLPVKKSFSVRDGRLLSESGKAAEGQP